MYFLWLMAIIQNDKIVILYKRHDEYDVEEYQFYSILNLEWQKLYFNNEIVLKIQV